MTPECYHRSEDIIFPINGNVLCMKCKKEWVPQERKSGSNDRSIAISLKRMEISQSRDRQTRAILAGYKAFESSAWAATQEEENKLLAELAELEKYPQKECSEEKFCKKCWNEGRGCASCEEKDCPSNQDFCHCGKDGHAIGSINCPVHKPERDTEKGESYDVRLRDLGFEIDDMQVEEREWRKEVLDTFELLEKKLDVYFTPTIKELRKRFT